MIFDQQLLSDAPKTGETALPSARVGSGRS